MSSNSSHNSEKQIETSEDPWDQLSEHRSTLEMCVEEDVPFADSAEKLLDRLDDE